MSRLNYGSRYPDTGGYSTLGGYRYKRIQFYRSIPIQEAYNALGANRYMGKKGSRSIKLLGNLVLLVHTDTLGYRSPGVYGYRGIQGS